METLYLKVLLLNKGRKRRIQLSLLSELMTHPPTEYLKSAPKCNPLRNGLKNVRGSPLIRVVAENALVGTIAPEYTRNFP